VAFADVGRQKEEMNTARLPWKWNLAMDEQQAESLQFHSPGQRPGNDGNSEEKEAGESEGVTKVYLRAIWPLWFT